MDCPSLRRKLKYFAVLAVVTVWGQNLKCLSQIDAIRLRCGNIVMVFDTFGLGRQRKQLCISILIAKQVLPTSKSVEPRVERNIVHDAETGMERYKRQNLSILPMPCVSHHGKSTTMLRWYHNSTRRGTRQRLGVFIGSSQERRASP